MTSVFGNTYTPFRIANLITNDILNQPLSCCFDSQGNLFIGTFSNSNAVFVLPPVDTTIFGVACTGNTLNSLSSISGLQLGNRSIVCVDSNDTLYIGSYGSVNGLYAIPHTSTTIFTVSCPADQATFLSPTVDPTDLIISPTGMTFDTNGNLIITNGWAQVYNVANAKLLVLPAANTTLFGISCTGNVMNDISVVDTENLLYSLRGICLDVAGNVYIGNDTSLDVHMICILPTSTGTVYGVACTQNVVSTLVTTTATAEGVRIDVDGNLFWIEYDDTLHTLPFADTNLFGQPCVKNTPTDLTPFVDPDTVLNRPYDLCFDFRKNLFLINRNSDTPGILPYITSGFPLFGGFGVYTTFPNTYLFHYDVVQTFLAGKSIPANQGAFFPEGIQLTDLRRTVYAYGQNRLKRYRFQEVQIPTSLISMYLCTWAASGIYPVMLS